MVKRYYMSRLALVFSMPMTLMALAVFAVAWMQNKNQSQSLKIVMFVLAVLLMIIMFFYYRNKFRINSVLRKAKDVNEYEKGGMLERSFILEDRMLAGCGLQVTEQKTTGIRQMDLEEKGHRLILHLSNEEGSFDAQVIDRDEAGRFAAFIKRKNPGVVLNNIEPKGKGTLEELGAGITV